jgi:hypothetical protein
MTYLVVDEFLRMNGTDDALVSRGKLALAGVFDNLSRLYGNGYNLVDCGFMKTAEYAGCFKKVAHLEDRLLHTVPQNRRHEASARQYPVHELACVQYLIRQGYEQKIGPSKEKMYDEVMQENGFPIGFGYLMDAYAVGTKSPDKVVHYVPESRGPNNGQRIFLDDSDRVIREKLLGACPVALEYIHKISAVSGYMLGTEVSGIQFKRGKKLKKTVINDFFRTVVHPYREVEK